MSDVLRILLIGDIMGRPGRQAATRLVPRWRSENRVDFVLANVENCAGGKGVTQSTVRELLDAGIDVATTGNHVWDNKDIFNFIESEPRLLRPANYPPWGEAPGRGYTVIESESGLAIGIVNLQGRVFMEPLECPFHVADVLVEELRGRTPVILVDFHAEATSEKQAMGWHLDGRVSAVFGTHTHVQTADERILPQGTAYITDIGMTGAHDSIIGMKPEEVLVRFRRSLPSRFEVAEKNVQLCGAIVTVDTATGRALSIERVREKL
ncbi:MAG: TIGR00282 family metallophosphoesterase [Candidatus Sumerlaeaceae bacterium]|nr:TIGR00282 family metallophosphoesterase [Candidatus Sumerlaeaceae bacterium]